MSFKHIEINDCVLLDNKKIGKVNIVGVSTFQVDTGDGNFTYFYSGKPLFDNTIITPKLIKIMSIQDYPELYL